MLFERLLDSPFLADPSLNSIYFSRGGFSIIVSSFGGSIVSILMSDRGLGGYLRAKTKASLEFSITEEVLSFNVKLSLYRLFKNLIVLSSFFTLATIARSFFHLESTPISASFDLATIAFFF